MIPPPKTGRSSSPVWATPRRWAEVALLLALVGGGLLLGAWKAGAAAPDRHVLDAELRACTRRVALGYVSYGIRIASEDALTIQAACERAVRESSQGRDPGL